MAFVYVVGGTGDMSGRATGNGGGYVLGTGTWLTAQDANGGPLVTVLGPTTEDSADNPGFVRLRKADAGEFSGAVVGVLANFQAPSYVNGLYEVTLVDGSGNYIDLDLVYGVSETATSVVVGGAYGNVASEDQTHLEWALDLCSADDWVKVRNDMLFTTTSQVMVDGTSGTDNAHIIVESVDAFGVRDNVNFVVVRRGAAGATAVIQFANSIENWDFWGFDFDGSDLSTRILYSAVNCPLNSMHNCVFHDPGASNVVQVRGKRWYFSGCEITGGVVGCLLEFAAYQTYINCWIHDNSGVGLNPEKYHLFPLT